MARRFGKHYSLFCKPFFKQPDRWMTWVATGAMVAVAWRGTARSGAVQGRVCGTASRMSWFAKIWRRYRGDELSFVGIVYLIGLVVVLLFVHVLHRQRSASYSQAPTQHERAP